MDKRRDIEKLWYFDTEEDFSGRSLSLSRKVDLKSYNDYETIGKSPDWIDWTDSESLEFDFVAKRILKIYADKFILQASEYGISRYERILGIEPGKNESLEERRKRVYLLWNKKIRWTHRTFLKWLDVYLGKDNYKLSLDYDKYGIELDVIIKKSLYFDLDDLGRQVRDIIPANLTQFIRIKFIRDQKIFYGMYGQKAKKITIMAVKPEDRVFNLSTYYGIGEVRKRLKRRAVMPDLWTVDDLGMMKEIEDGSEVDMKYDR
ncbi:MAG: putative phage tail protein [Peptoniphilus harei]|nr:putative phage tail protein [Peptoniphilus harei]